MKILFAAWVFIARCFAWTYFRLHTYQYWSYLFRFVWQGKFKDVAIMTFDRIHDLAVFLKDGKDWKADSWRALWDAVGEAGRTQLILSGALVVEEDNDCDEYANFNATAIDASLKAGKMKEDNVANPRFLTVTWIETDTWKTGGHNVCLLERKRDGSTWYSYMDYNDPSKEYPDINSLAEGVRTAEAGAGKYVGVMWCAAGIDLKPWIVHWG